MTRHGRHGRHGLTGHARKAHFRSAEALGQPAFAVAPAAREPDVLAAAAPAGLAGAAQPAVPELPAAAAAAAVAAANPQDLLIVRLRAKLRFVRRRNRNLERRVVKLTELVASLRELSAHGLWGLRCPRSVTLASVLCTSGRVGLWPTEASASVGLSAVRRRSDGFESVASRPSLSEQQHSEMISNNSKRHCRPAQQQSGQRLGVCVSQSG